jgi:Protein of unknown function (DUF2852)
MKWRAVMTDTASTTTQSFEPRMQRGCSGGMHMNKKPWSIYEIGAVLGGFALFWPVGLVALFLKMKKGEIWKGASEMEAPWSNWQKTSENVSNFAGKWNRGSSTYESGNRAFDEYRSAKIAELEALRRKLDDERREFDEFLTKLRHAKDRDDFERFMADRNAPKSES